MLGGKTSWCQVSFKYWLSNIFKRGWSKIKKVQKRGKKSEKTDQSEKSKFFSDANTLNEQMFMSILLFAVTHSVG